MNEKQHTLTRTAFSMSREMDFFSRKELTAQTGHKPEDWLLVAIKELVDNALDACEEHGIAPEIQITVDAAGIVVKDNGPGIPPKVVEGVTDFNRRISSREAYVAPDRGAQGNALKTLLAMPYVLNGESGRVDIAARGIRHEITLTADRVRQKAVIDHQQYDDGLAVKGTMVRIYWPNSATGGEL